MAEPATRRVLVAPDALQAWLAAAGLAGRPVEAAAFAVLTTAAGRTAFCTGACRCLQAHEWGTGLVGGLAAARWEAVPAARAAPGRQPLVWLAGCASGIAATATGPEPHPGPGWRKREAAPRGADFMALRRLSVPRSAGTQPTARHGLALVECAAHVLRPSREAWCPHCGAFSGAVGAAAYEALADALSAGLPTASAGALVRSWHAARQASAAYLHRRSGAGTRPWARRLARAAVLAENEAAGHLAPALRAVRTQEAAEAADHLRTAGALAAASARLSLEAGALMLHLPAAIRAALAADPLEPLRATDLHEVVYVARAWATPFKLLAARRLAGSRERQAVATLAQLLWGRDRALTDTAAWSLLQGGTHEGVQAVEAYRARAAEVG